MGLREKKAVSEFQSNEFKAFLNNLKNELGLEVEIEVHWDQMVDHIQADSAASDLSKIYFDPIKLGLTELCADDFTKQAVQEGVKKIVVRNDNGNNYSAHKWAKFDGGVVDLNHCAKSNADNYAERAKYFREAIENGL